MQSANEKATKTIETFRSLTFGIEIETAGITRAAAADAIAAELNGGARIGRTTVGGFYGKEAARMSDGRQWIAMSDSSIESHNGHSAEVVSPICTVDDIEMVQRVVRALKAAGATVNESCGVHIHVSTAAGRLDPKATRRLVQMFYSQEELIFASVAASRTASRWCRQMGQNENLMSAMRRGIDSERDLSIAWYGNASNAAYAQGNHYDHTRYQAVNLHSRLSGHGTIEFRMFEPTLHAGRIRAYITLALGLVAKAKASKSVPQRRRSFNAVTAREDFRIFLQYQLGMWGRDVFANVREHLLANFAKHSAVEVAAARRANGRTRRARTAPAAAAQVA